MSRQQRISFENKDSTNMQESYMNVAFDNEIHNTVKYQLNQFDERLRVHLNKLRDTSQHGSNSITAYEIKAAKLRSLILSYSKVNKPSAFFSKKFLPNHARHELLTEGGYPNDQFRIQLLARAIIAIDDPINTENIKQLGLIYTILPKGTSNKLPILLGLTAFLLAGVALTGLMLIGPAPIIPGAILLTMFAVGTVSSLFVIHVIAAMQTKHDTYEEYINGIKNISCNLSSLNDVELLPPDADIVPDAGSSYREFIF